LVCPPFTALSKISELVKGTNIKLGAQNCSYAESGAYTGEVSVDMLKDAGCDYVILGHSERRVLFGETDEVINKKAKLAISKGLKVVFCVGEVLEERENEKTFEVIKKQIINGLQDLDLNNIIIAYEPVWAIGTGKTASPEQAEEVHSFIRNLIATEFSSNCCSCCCSSKNCR
jgi:triosephosphate isomerase (TIM)